MADNAESLESLKAKRKTLKACLTKLETKIEAYPADPNLGLVEAHSIRLNEIWNDLTLNHYAILGHLKTQADVEAQESDYSANESRVTDLRAILFSVPRQTPRSSTQSNRSSPSSDPKPTEIRLPTMDLPSFSGSLQDWMSFRDLFTATIRNNASLAPAQKLQYLKSCLRGDAARIIQSMQFTDNNYDVAWEMLQQRFEHSRELVFAQLRRLINQPHLQSESANGLRELIDTTKECIRSLEILKQPCEHWGSILVFVTLQKLDSETRKLWELSLKNNDVPEFSSLLIFLEQHAQALNSISSTRRKSHGPPASKQKEKIESKPNAKVHHASNDSKESKIKCSICDGTHPYFRCSSFLSLSASDKLKLAKERKLCLNCLRPNHFVAQCTSDSSCKTCGEKHHTFLHFDKQPSKSQESTVASNFVSRDDKTQVLLATALVKVMDGNGNLQVCRAFLDNGSQASFVSNSCVNRLNLPRSRIDLNVCGLAATAINNVKYSCVLNITSIVNPRYSFTVETANLPQVTGMLPNLPCDSSSWDHISTLKLADPQFYKPGKIDILLGADIVPEILLDDIRRGISGSPIAQETKLGWVLYGKAKLPSSTSTYSAAAVVSHSSQLELDKALTRFWELEETNSRRTLTREEIQCEDHFATTHERTQDGRYVVRLPFKTSDSLGNSRDIASRRLKSIERKLENNPEMKTQYHKFMQEYLDLGHMRPVPAEELQMKDEENFYLPHHCVLKESSTTTKLRVVFDGSAKSSSGISLNEKLMVGPVVQDDLWSILLRFRSHLIALIGDLVKMYRQIRIHLKDVNYQRILWRFSSSDPIGEYQLLTVTYGTASAPYLATKVLQQLANDEESTLPLAAEVTKTDFGVDDLMSGASSVSSALELQKQLIEMAKRGGFEFQKWASNSNEVLEAVPPECRGTNLPLTIDSDESIKALGLRWNPSSDCFSFTVEPFNFDYVLTKRRLLSDIARIYDPAGWLSCVTVKAKIVMQKLWLEKLTWDDPIPFTIGSEWVSYRSHLSTVERLNIPRCIIPADSKVTELHGFCDSSEKAYAACVYVRTVTEDSKVTMHLLTSKTKVAPLKQISLPRLELCGAVLLSRLITSAAAALHINFNSVCAWSDSKTVLDWISSPPQRWKTFVANRVAEIQSTNPLPVWNHISGKLNPADLASRGILPTDIHNNSLWWNGPPDFLQYNFKCSSIDTLSTEDSVKEERKQITISHVTIDLSIINRCSTLKMLKRITAYLLRFRHNCHAKKLKAELMTGPLTAVELNLALLKIISQVQGSVFGEEIHVLTSNEELSKKSKLLCLRPFLDANKVLRVGGRLRNSTLPMEQKNPILLPSNHILTTLIIRDVHFSHLHAGPQLMLQALRENYWILGGKNTIKKIYRKCITCFRQMANVNQQLMGDLPSARVTPSPAFNKCGVDFAGPFLLRAIKGRGQKRYKAYVSLFVCFCTRAIHLELVSDLSTQAFIAALKRFIGRRGKPAIIHSDCGTNFIGANRELRELQTLVESSNHNNKVSHQLSSEGIQWAFNPPSAPHFGGLWEAGVKSFKYHLRRIVGNEVLNFEEMTTVLVEIEAVLNSRPLSPLSDDPNDLLPLTPGHFLIGRPLTAISEPSYEDIKLNRLSRWQLTEKVVQHFWKRWSSEYLSRLQQRPRWIHSQPNLQVNNLVLLKDERLPKLQWKLGRILMVHPGPDGKVRVVTLKTADGEYKRPVAKVCLLPLDFPDSL